MFLDYREPVKLCKISAKLQKPDSSEAVHRNSQVRPQMCEAVAPCWRRDWALVGLLVVLIRW